MQYAIGDELVLSVLETDTAIGDARGNAFEKFNDMTKVSDDCREPSRCTRELEPSIVPVMKAKNIVRTQKLLVFLPCRGCRTTLL